MTARWLVVVLLAAASIQAADLYRVAGTVTNGQSGTPVPHAQIYLYKSGTPAPRSPFITESDGRFSFDVPQGTYVMRAGTRTLIQSYGSRSPEMSLGSAVIVGPDHDTSNLIFRWYPPSAISGKIVDESGEPAEGVLVQLLLARTASGRKVTATLRWARTDDQGGYRFGMIPGGGRYYLAATGKPWYTNNAMNAGGNAADQRPVAFVPVYYPNTLEASKAAPIVVKPGEEARADLRMIPAAGATVTVTCTTAVQLKGTLSLITEGVGGTESFQEQRSITLMPNMPRQIPQTILSVPPGHYVARIAGTTANGDFLGSVPVDVNGSDVTVDVPLRPAATITGVAHFQTSAAKPAGAVRISLFADFGGIVRSAVLQSDGSFVLPNVPAGRFHIVASATPPLFISQVAGTDFRTGLMTVSAGDPITLSLTLSDELGGLTGTVTEGDHSAPTVLVVLAPFEESRDAARYRGFQTESDGSFAYRNVPSGKYYLFAVDDSEFEYGNAATVRPYLAGAKLVTINAHASSAENIPLASPR